MSKQQDGVVKFFLIIFSDPPHKRNIFSQPLPKKVLESSFKNPQSSIFDINWLRVAQKSLIFHSTAQKSISVEQCQNKLSYKNSDFLAPHNETGVNAK